MITRFSPTPLLGPLAEHKAVAILPRASNGTVDALQVICAWPLSGQYGPGSRLLFYAFLITSIFSRRAQWLRTACFAATMLFPAVAALHGIVLASVHVEGAVDMDIYGAFQTCALGTIAASVTINLSPEYSHDLGRNAILLWACLILAGLISIMVEFFRVTTSDCTSDDFGHPISNELAKFPYGNATCDLTCSIGSGPWSPIRSGSTNNIYVIPSPVALTPGITITWEVVCCIPACAMLASLWKRVLTDYWRERFGATADHHARIEGTNGETLENMLKVKTRLRKMIHVVELPLVGALALAILIIGEVNFWSAPVRYQTEPMSSIGEWAPIVGTGVALLVGFVQGRVEEDGSSSTSDTDHVHEPKGRTHQPSPVASEEHHMKKPVKSNSSVADEGIPNSPRASPPPPRSPTISAIVRNHRPTEPSDETHSLSIRSLPSSLLHASLEE